MQNNRTAELLYCTFKLHSKGYVNNSRDTYAVDGYVLYVILEFILNLFVFVLKRTICVCVYILKHHNHKKSNKIEKNTED